MICLTLKVFVLSMSTVLEQSSLSLLAAAMRHRRILRATNPTCANGTHPSHITNAWGSLEGFHGDAKLISFPWNQLFSYKMYDESPRLGNQARSNRARSRCTQMYTVTVMYEAFL